MAQWTELTDTSARAAMAAYFAKVDRALAPLPLAEAEQVKAELQAHALDALADAGDVNTVLAQLGDPDEFLKDLVADRMRALAGRTFKPGDVLAALARSAGSGLAGLALSALIGIGYAIAVIALVLGVLKLFAPHGVGVYRLETGELFIGHDEAVRGVDLLGFWFSPLAIAVSVCLYLALTWAFGRTAVRKSALPKDAKR